MNQKNTQKAYSDLSSYKERIFEIIQIGKHEDIVSRVFDVFIILVIVANISVLFLQTFESLNRYKNIFSVIEDVTMIAFIIEYILRIWTADLQFPGRKYSMAILKFMISFDGVVMLLTILPFFFLSGFVAFRMLRIVRILHLFRINSKYDSFNVITSVLIEKKNQIISSVFIIFVLMMASSLCMYSAEHEVQPDVFNNAFSGIWWSVSTILTVGYGDIYPITIFGRIMAIVIAILGVGAVAIPTGIISAGFVESYTKMQNTKDMTVPATVTALIEKDGTFTGLKTRELREQYSVNPILIIRKGDIVYPNEKTKLIVGDRLIYQTFDLYNTKMDKE